MSPFNRNCFLKIAVLFLTFLLSFQFAFTQTSHFVKIEKDKKKYRYSPLEKKVLYKEQSSNYGLYSITLCVDIPDNANPKKVNVGRETGHVFIILSSIDSVKDLFSHFVYGFYPLHPAKSIIFRKVRSIIFDNGDRKYDIAVRKTISANEFYQLIDLSLELAKKRYHLNKFNCYDYAVEIFNSIMNIEKIPVSKIKLPFLLGKAGSPCGLYKDLVFLKKHNEFWKPYIQVGEYKAPKSCTNMLKE